MLEIVVFICGAVVMIIELVGSRVLAPYVGTSVVVWTSIIGVILAALSLGYWWGGRLADKHPSLKALSRIILGASAATVLIAFSREFILQALQANTGGVHMASLKATILLFAPAGVLLGMVAPFAARIRLTDAATAGRTVGRLYALSTLGSIAGTFAGGFFLIAFIGSANILFLMAAVLALTAMACHFSQVWLKAGLAALYLCFYLLALADGRALAARGLVDVDTPYQRLLVYPATESATGRAMRMLSTGPEGVQGGMYLDDPAALALVYARYFTLSGHFVPKGERMLVLGGGTYNYPKYVLAHDPGMRVNVVELDPGVTAVAREFFGLADSPRLRIVHEDARTFLNANKDVYDIIIEDVFNSHVTVPFHVASKEAVTRIRESLAEDGVVLVNCIGALEGPRSRFFRTLYATYAAVFPQVYVLRVWSGADPQAWQNFMLVAFKNTRPPAWTSPGPEFQAMLEKRLPAPDTAGALVLTDDYAPVERLVSGWDLP